MSGGNVKVVCRFRPQLENELLKGGANIALIDGNGKTVTIDSTTKKVSFTYDRVFGHDSTQDGLYDYAARPIVEDVLKGYNGTIFAYGQTSSGKTHTMEGPDIDGPDRGVIPRIVQNVFQYIDLAPETLEFTVKVSYFEIYMEKIRDLLCDGNNNLEIHESKDRGVYVRHVTEIYMQDPEDVLEVMRAGAERRSVASTKMNDISSRSHSVFLMEISQKDTIKGGQKTGKLFLVDLAGSEKVSKTGADGTVLDEAKNINKSLSTLGLVIRNLTDGQSHTHIPYRDSKLTRILQESLGGNARTTIVICCSPSSYNEQETLSTLRFGQRAKKIQNNAVINVQYSREELEKMLDQSKKEIKKLVKRLKLAESELEIWRSGGKVSEEDRVALSSESAGLSSMGTDSEEQQQGGGLSEAEREELLQRETELLDLLDEKDNHIKELEQEIEMLGQDKITITKLAAEKMELEEQLEDRELHEEELMAENKEYEMAIEDMAAANNRLDAALKELEEAKLRTEAELLRHQEDLMNKMSAVAEAIGQLPDVESELSTTDTICDPRLATVRSIFSELNQDASGLQETKQGLESSLAEIKEKYEQANKSLTTTKLSLSQTESKLSEAEESRTKLSQDLAEVQKKKEELQARLEGVMSEAMQHQEKGAKQAEDLQKALEAEREQRLNDHKKEVSGLQEQLQQASEKYKGLLEEKNKADLLLEEMKADLEQQKKLAEEQTGKLKTLETVSEERKTQEKKRKQYEQNAKQQLAKFDHVKKKLRQSIMDQCNKVLEDLSNKKNEEPPTATKMLSDELEKLRAHNQELSKEKSSLQREVTVLSRQCNERLTRLKNLQQLMKKSEERYQSELAKRKPGPQLVRGGSGNDQRFIRGGKHRGSNDRSAAKFWANQKSTNGRQAPIKDSGEPLVGNARRKVEAPVDEDEATKLTVEYV